MYVLTPALEGLSEPFILVGVAQEACAHALSDMLDRSPALSEAPLDFLKFPHLLLILRILKRLFFRVTSIYALEFVLWLLVGRFDLLTIIY